MLRRWDGLSLAVLQAKPATTAALDRAKVRKERALLHKNVVSVTHSNCTAAESVRSAPQLSCRLHRRSEGGGRAPYWQQGDIALYSTDALQVRMALRRVRQVAEALESWWQAARRSLLHTRDDTLAIDREQYVSLYARIYHALVGGTGFSARACAEAEWRHDSHGRPSMSRELFLDAVFALAECAAHANQSTHPAPPVRTAQRLASHPTRPPLRQRVDENMRCRRVRRLPPQPSRASRTAGLVVAAKKPTDARCSPAQAATAANQSVPDRRTTPSLQGGSAAGAPRLYRPPRGTGMEVERR